MTYFEVIERLLEIELCGEPGSARQNAPWMDFALDNGIGYEVILDEEAEHDRVRSATGPLALLPLIERCPLAPTTVRCAGLRAISPSEGGHFQSWMAARIARLWRARGGTLFRYVTKRKTRMNEFDAATETWRQVRAFSEVRKKQRWETRDFIDLALGDSPPHLSGFPPAPGTKAKLRGVAGPRRGHASNNEEFLTTGLLTPEQLSFGR